VLLYVPFLQVRFAAENRFRTFFEVSAVRAAFKRAPWAFAHRWRWNSAGA
jgi:hypothetical protein